MRLQFSDNISVPQHQLTHFHSHDFSFINNKQRKTIYLFLIQVIVKVDKTTTKKMVNLLIPQIKGGSLFSRKDF